jgi:hypothetical protein
MFTFWSSRESHHRAASRPRVHSPASLVLAGRNRAPSNENTGRGRGFQVRPSKRQSPRSDHLSEITEFLSKSRRRTREQIGARRCCHHERSPSSLSERQSRCSNSSRPDHPRAGYSPAGFPSCLITSMSATISPCAFKPTTCAPPSRTCFDTWGYRNGIPYHPEVIDWFRRKTAELGVEHFLGD